eukprot:4262322-Pyramimonas_sp.AAC.1
MPDCHSFHGPSSVIKWIRARIFVARHQAERDEFRVGAGAFLQRTRAQPARRIRVGKGAGLK